MAAFAAGAIYEALERYSHKRLVVETEEALTGQDLLYQTASVADILRQHGTTEGSRVLICVKTSVDTLILWLAAWRLGATPIITDIRTPVAQLGRIIEAAGVNVLVSVKNPGAGDGFQYISWNEEFRYAPTKLPAIPDLLFDHGHPAMFNLSSGTTGDPKIYIRYHDELLARVESADRESRHKGDFSFLAAMSLGFSATRTAVMANLLKGSLTIFYPILFSTSELIDAFLTNRISATYLAPTIVHNLVREIGTRKAPIFGSMEMTSVGGAPSSHDNLAAYEHLTRGYRLTYASGLTGTVSILEGKDIRRRPASTGRIVDYAHVDILDPDSHEILPHGESGLIRVKSPYVVREVIMPREAPTAGSHEQHGDGWGIPGDIGIVDDEGFLTIVGRANDMIVRGGVNVSPMEIESVLIAHPDVRDVGVVGIDDDRYGQEIVAFIVAPGKTAADIQALCARSISSEKRPRKICLVDSLPYNSAGKLQRSRLAELLANQEE